MLIKHFLSYACLKSQYINIKIQSNISDAVASIAIEKYYAITLFKTLRDLF